MGWRRRSTSTETRRDETRPHPIYYIARRLLPSTGPRSPPSLYLSFSDKRAHTRRLHFFGFGLKTLTTWSFPSSLGPPMRSTQYGIAGNTASRHVLTAAGFPGRVTTRDLNRMPAGRRQKERERRGRSLLDLDRRSDCFGLTCGLPRQDRGGHPLQQRGPPHFLAKAGHELVADPLDGLWRHVPRSGARTPRGHDQRAPLALREAHQRILDHLATSTGRFGEKPCFVSSTTTRRRFGAADEQRGEPRRWREGWDPSFPMGLLGSLTPRTKFLEARLRVPLRCLLLNMWSLPGSNPLPSVRPVCKRARTRTL